MAAQSGDTGTAARYFLNADWALETAERIAGAVPFLYTAKASTWEREAGLRGERQFLATMGDGIGAREHNESQPTAWRLNSHPTIKSLALARWLATLLLPPDAYAPRRLLVPFAGAASEMVGACLAGWDFVQGVELMTEYAAIAYQRLEFWQQYAGLDWDAAQEYARAKQDALERGQLMDAPLDDLPLFGWTED
jgi:hypothetical protein